MKPWKHEGIRKCSSSPKYILYSYKQNDWKPYLNSSFLQSKIILIKESTSDFRDAALLAYDSHCWKECSITLSNCLASCIKQNVVVITLKLYYQLTWALLRMDSNPDNSFIRGSWAPKETTLLQVPNNCEGILTIVKFMNQSSMVIIMLCTIFIMNRHNEGSW